MVALWSFLKDVLLVQSSFSDQRGLTLITNVPGSTTLKIRIEIASDLWKFCVRVRILRTPLGLKNMFYTLEVMCCQTFSWGIKGFNKNLSVRSKTKFETSPFSSI